MSIAVHCKQNENFNVLCSSGGRAFLSRYVAERGDVYPFYPVHKHEELEVVMVCDGTLTVCCDGVNYTATKGDVCVFPPFSMHAFCALSSQSVTLHAVLLNFRLASNSRDFVGVDRYAAFFNGSAPACHMHGDNADEIGATINALFGARTNSDETAVEVGNLLALLQSHATVGSPSITDRKRTHAAREAIDYVAATLPGRVEVADVAGHCGYSEFYLMKLFKAFTGFSVIDYANRLRLFNAERMLSSGNRAVCDIARAVGFENISYFNRQFLRLYGMTPTEFRDGLTQTID